MATDNPLNAGSNHWEYFSSMLYIHCKKEEEIQKRNGGITTSFNFHQFHINRMATCMWIYNNILEIGIQFYLELDPLIRKNSS